MYRPPEGGLSQGDIVRAYVARVTTETWAGPTQWEDVDRFELTATTGDSAASDLHVLAGETLVMVTSHDCHHDKEWNKTRRRLVRDGTPDEEAERLASQDDHLDLTFHASPIIPIDLFPPDEHGNLRAGRVVGYFPLTEPADGIFQEAVVDLSYRCTIDRHIVEDRVLALALDARAKLRYAIARFDSFRSVAVDESIESAVGRSITKVAVESETGLTVTLELDDHTTLELVQVPTEPDPGGRTAI